jgi:hypothetical protein
VSYLSSEISASTVDWKLPGESRECSIRGEVDQSSRFRLRADQGGGRLIRAPSTGLLDQPHYPGVKTVIPLLRV